MYQINSFDQKILTIAFYPADFGKRSQSPDACFLSTVLSTIVTFHFSFCQSKCIKTLKGFILKIQKNNPYSGGYGVNA